MESSKIGHVLKSKRIAAIVATVALVTFINFTKVHAASTTSRFNGTDRYETAAKACEDGWNQDTDYAVIVNGENYPDAISAAPLAKKYEAPILLTGKDTLNAYTSVELNRLNVKNVFIIGGKGVVSQSIEDSLKARGIKITRIGGADRYETGVQVAQKLGKPSEIAVVNADDFHDGLSVAPIAALKGMPIILTSRDSLPDVSKKYLQANKKVDQTYVVGGTEQVSDSVFNLIPNGKRIGSGDVYARNIAVIDVFKSEISTGTIYVASAKDFPDSLVASALAPRTSSPVFYVDDTVPEDSLNFLRTKIVNNVKIVGGLGAVSYDAQTEVESAPLGVYNVNNFTDVIWQNDKYTPRPTILVTATDGTEKEVPVTWNVTKINTSKPGTYTISGKINDTDKTVTTTLVVRPIPIKIDDIATKSTNGYDYSLPSTVSAQMSDGTLGRVAVTWDLGSQQTNNPGTYVFSGTVDHYSKKVKLTMTSIIAAQILTVPDVKLKLSSLSSFYSSSFYTSIPAQMSDGTSKNVTVAWNTNGMTQYPGYSGVYQCTGTVSGYDGTVNALLIIGSATDPTPDVPTTSNSSSGSLTYLSSMQIMQGDPYSLPTKATDPISGKQLAVTWKTINIDPTNVDTGYIETSRVSAITFEGTLTGSTAKVGIVVNVRPRIAGIDPESLKKTISRSSYSGTTYSLPTTITAVMQDGSKRSINVTSWDVPTIDTGTSQIYYIKGTVNLYSSPVTFVLTITN